MQKIIRDQVPQPPFFCLENGGMGKSRRTNAPGGTLGQGDGTCQMALYHTRRKNASKKTGGNFPRSAAGSYEALVTITRAKASLSSDGAVSLSSSVSGRLPVAMSAHLSCT